MQAEPCSPVKHDAEPATMEAGNMKAKSTIQKQIKRLEKIADSEDVPENIRQESYEAYHALRWVIEDTSWTPATLTERRASEAEGSEDGSSSG